MRSRSAHSRVEPSPRGILDQDVGIADDGGGWRDELLAQMRAQRTMQSLGISLSGRVGFISAGAR